MRLKQEGTPSCDGGSKVLCYTMSRVRTKYRVLVIDDDEALASMIGQMLRRMGYYSVACNRPLDALTLFSRAPERFDAVIVDEMMPDMRGTLLATQLLRVRDDIPIILMTGHGDRITLEQVRESGVRAALIKPVLKERLHIVLSGLFR
jgi:two-component system, cell cycle sensor histidine kinase and response regulator CckA